MNSSQQRLLIFLSLCALILSPCPQTVADETRPNILFAIADDWGWPHAGAYGDPVVKTPAFDRIANEGVLIKHAFVSSPSCTPSRNAILTGQYHWRLGWGANLWSKLDTKHKTYPHLLEDAGYFCGHWRKSWGPGKLDNWPKHPAGKRFKSLDQFLKDRPADKPFCFWLGASDPHRPYKKGTGEKSGMDLSKIKLFGHYPDSKEIRSDVADYYFEVQRFDHDVENALKKLESLGLLENTIVVMTGDHGMPFPRCKGNVYDSGARVPLAIRWPKRIKPGRTVDDFVSLTDLAPTFLELGNVDIPDAMTGKSLTPVLFARGSGRIQSHRDRVFTGKERHTPAQEAPDRGGTPMRALRTDEFLLIHNFRPDRWPAGTPFWERAVVRGRWFSDCDNGPTKTYIVENKNRDSDHMQKYALCFAKRPEFECYDLKIDPDQLKNVAYHPGYLAARREMQKVLAQELRDTGDPRAFGNGDAIFDTPDYFGSGPRHPDWRREQQNKKKQKKKANDQALSETQSALIRVNR